MSSSHQTRHLIFWLFLFGAFTEITKADAFDDLEIHGFATQGFVKTSANSFFGDSENGSFEFTELGVNATIEPSPSVRLSGQLLYRRAGDIYSDDVSVDFALADVTVSSTEASRLSMLLGRVKNPFGFYNETRDVSFARPSMFVPQVVYFDKLRNVILSSDGVGVEFEQYGENVNTSIYVAAGRPQIDENIEYVYLGRDFSGEFKPDGLSAIARVLIEESDSNLRAALSFATTSLDFERGDQDPIGDGNVSFEYWIASLQYMADEWTFTAEYMLEPIEWSGFSGSFYEGMRTEAEGYYLQAAWQAREDIEFLFRYEEGFADRADRSGADIERDTWRIVPSHTRYSKIWTMGVRWDVSSNTTLRAEYQKHNGTFILSNRDNRDLSDQDSGWDLFSLSASYRF